MLITKPKKVVKIPAKIARGIGTKYPVADMVQGDVILVTPEKEDNASDLKSFCKRISGSIKQVERRLGKTPSGKKIRDFAVWVDDTAGGVYVALREDNSGEKAKKVVIKKVVETPVIKSTPVDKKAVPIVQKKATLPVTLTPEPLAPKAIPPKPAPLIK
jgi:hypothetical protein